MRGLRTAETELGGVDESLRARFSRVCKELEEIVVQETPPDLLIAKFEFPDVGSPMQGFDQPIGADHQKDSLDDEFDSVVAEIRKVPGHEEFLQMAPYSKLRSAAGEGPVIILTVVGTNKPGLVRLPNHGVAHAIIVRNSRDPPIVLQLGEGEEFEKELLGVSSTLSWIRENLHKNPVEAALIQLSSTLSRAREILRNEDNVTDQLAQNLADSKVFATALTGIRSRLSEIRKVLHEKSNPDVDSHARRLRQFRVFEAAFQDITSKIHENLCKNVNVQDSHDSDALQSGESRVRETVLEDISSTLLWIRENLHKNADEGALVDLRSSLSEALGILSKSDKATDSQDPVEGHIEVFEDALTSISSKLLEIRKVLGRNINARDSQDAVAPRSRVFELAFKDIRLTLSRIRKNLCKNDKFRDSDPAALQLGEGRVFQTVLRDISSTLSEIRKDLGKSDNVRDPVEGEVFETTLTGIRSTCSEIRSYYEKACNDKLSQVLKDIGELFVKEIVGELRKMGIKNGTPYLVVPNVCL